MAIYKISTAKASGHSALKAILRYVLNEAKTPSRLYEVTGHFEKEEITASTVFDSFVENKRSWHKDAGRMYTHAIISFHKNEKITPEQVREFAADFSAEAYPGHQVLVVVHEDQGHLHAHQVVDTVNYMDGGKLHCTRQDLDRQHKICTRLCRERGFRVMQKGYHFDGTEMDEQYAGIPNRNKYYALKRGTVDQPQGIDLYKLLSVILYALLHGRGIIGFLTILNENKWRMKRKPNRQYITFTSMETGRQFRDSNIEKTFGNQLRNVFGEDFVLDKKHIERIVSVPERDRRWYYTQARKVLEELEKDPRFADVLPWQPTQKTVETNRIRQRLRRMQEFHEDKK